MFLYISLFTTKYLSVLRLRPKTVPRSRSRAYDRIHNFNYLGIMADVKTKVAASFKTTLAVRVRPSITKLQIEKILDRIYKENGCPSCGLGGRDFLLRFDDPRFERERFVQIQQFENVINVEMLANPVIDQSFTENGIR